MKKVISDKMYILGISAYYHDSAAALIRDGALVAAVEEERFTRKKHDNSFPFNAIEYCLKEAGISMDDVSFVALYEKPLIKFERIVQTFVETYPLSYIPFWRAVPDWITKKLSVRSTIRKKLKYKEKILFIPHHEAHASSAFFVSPFRKAAILTIDGAGEWKTTSLYLGENNQITPLEEINFPHSIGLLYSTFTAFLGFKVNEDEYKVMGLAAYGKPKYYKEFSKFITVNEDGSYALNMKYFSFRETFRMWSSEIENLLGKPRKPDEKVNRRHADIAATLQKVTEEIYFKILNHLYNITKIENLCIAGGVALNSLANGKIYTNTPFKKVFIQGAAGDSGAALGATYFVWNHLLNKKRVFELSNLYCGSEYSNEYIKTFLDNTGASYKYFEGEELTKTVAKLLAKNNVIGWFQGRMEFGPRALGNRSILANPKPRWMKDRVNEIKRREHFRPFAGSVLQEKVHEYYDVPEKNHISPFMVFCFPAKLQKRKEIAAIVHNDGTCRIQTVDEKNNALYYQLIKDFENLTGIPVILNTSFNLKGEPIVCKPEEAYDDFLRTKMDYLVIGNFLISRNIE
jgi:carbamoyltransferase